MFNFLTPVFELILVKLFFIVIVYVNLNNALTNVKCESEDGGDTFVYKSYQTSVYCKSSYPIQLPENAKELQTLVKFAIASNLTVKVIGSRHSVTDIICTEGIPIHVGYINYTHLSDNGETVTVGSGAQLTDVLDALRENGRTLITVPSYGGITIGGAIGTGAHGSSLQYPTTISDQVVGLTIVDGLGRIRKIALDSDDLPAFRTHLGLLGAIVDVTLKTVPLFKMTVLNYLDTESILLDGSAMSEAEEYPWYEMFWFPSSKSVVVSKGSYMAAELTNDTPGTAQTTFYPNLNVAEILASRNALEETQATKNLQAQYSIQEYVKKSFYKEVAGRPPIFEEESEAGKKVFVNPATGYAYQLQSNRCTDCAWNNGNQSVNIEEYALAFHINEFRNMVVRIKEILEELPAAFMMIGIWIRFAKSSDGLMSNNNGRNSVIIDWATPMRFDPYTKARDRIGTYQAMQQALIHELDGRPHWGKNGQYYFTHKILQRRPRRLLLQFQKAIQKYDPNGVFMNKFGRRILLQSDELSVDPSTTRCALMDYCMCSRNEDCAESQICSEFERRYPICKPSYSDLIPNNPFP